MARYASALVSLLLALLAITNARAAEWGTLTGRFVYDGKPPVFKPISPTKDIEVCGKQEIPDEGLVVGQDKGIANVVVMLKTKNPAVAPSYESAANEQVVLDNKNCRFQPHVAVIRTSQTLALKNSDPVGHNSKVDPLANPGVNPILPAGGDPVTHKFTAEEGLPVKVGCNIHPWMGAWIVVRKDPYAAVSGPDGKFIIKDLPAGSELEFGLWQEDSGYLKNVTYKGGKADTRGRFKIKLKPGDNDLGDINVSPSIFKKK
jgi:plastocyanin